MGRRMSEYIFTFLVIESKESDVRITFDADIQSGLYNYDLFDNNMPRYIVDEKGKQVLEVKFNKVLPLHIAKILNDIPACREAVSKFAICRKIK